MSFSGNVSLLTATSLQSIEEFVLEACDKTSKNNYSKLLIKKRASDGIYFCQLSLRPPPSDDDLDTSTSRDILFRLGLVTDAEKYIQQYVKIFTEDGRRAVNIKHNLIPSTYHQHHTNTNNIANNTNTSEVFGNTIENKTQGSFAL